MALKIQNNKAKSAPKKAKDLCPAGQFPARLVRIIDLGLHPKINYKTGKIEGEQYKVRFTYELLTSFLKDEEGNDMKDKPRWISEDVNISKALMYDDSPAQPWYSNCGIVQRYRAISGNPVGVVDDISELLGEACSVLVVHEPNKNNPEIIYANVGDVAADPYAMMGQEAPALVNEAKMFDLAEPNMELYDEQPAFIKERILKNLEFSGSMLEKLLNGEEGQDVPDADDVDGHVADGGINPDDNPW